MTALLVTRLRWCGDIKIVPRRDAQRKKLYTAEEVLQHAYPNLSEEAAQLFVRKVEQTCFWQKLLLTQKFPAQQRRLIVFLPKVDLRCRKQSRSTAWPDRGRIHMASKFCNAITLLHELAHLACPTYTKHSWLFAKTYLRLIERFLGRPTAKLMRDRFRFGGVKYRKPPSYTTKSRR